MILMTLIPDEPPSQYPSIWNRYQVKIFSVSSYKKNIFYTVLLIAGFLNLNISINFEK